MSNRGAIPKSTVKNKRVIDELVQKVVDTTLDDETQSQNIRHDDDVESTKDTQPKNANLIDMENSEDNNETNEPSSDDQKRKDIENDEFYVDEESIKKRDEGLTKEELMSFKRQAEAEKDCGNQLFKDKDFAGATKTYTEGLRICPLDYTKDRAVLYANRAASRSKYVSDLHLAISDCTKAIELDESYVKAYLRRAHLCEQIDKLDDAVLDYKKVLEIDPTNRESFCSISRLEPIIQERNEKLKAEMLGKLKDIGNMFLKPFGLSTENFQVNKDDSTGSYSINFNQNSTRS